MGEGRMRCYLTLFFLLTFIAYHLSRCLLSVICAKQRAPTSRLVACERDAFFIGVRQICARKLLSSIHPRQEMPDHLHRSTPTGGQSLSS